MRLLYVGDTDSPHFRAWPAHFAGRGHEVHALHLAPGPEGEPVPGVTAHPRPRSSRSAIRGAWLAGAWPARRLWRRLRPDLVHSHQVVPCGFLCELGGLEPHVATAWGSEVLRAGQLAGRPIARVARGAELITADSHHLLAALERRGAGPDRLRWVPWGVSSAWRDPALAVSAAEAAGRLGLDTGRGPVVLSHRGTREIYRQDVFVRALAELRDRGRELQGVIVALDPSAAADGARRSRELIAELGLEGSVSLVPRFPHREIAFAFRAASVCVSVPESDSAPTSVFEALAVGTPAIVSDLPWVHEPVYREARLGVVPVGDHMALAAAIERAVLEPSEADAAANRELVERHFDRDRLFDEVEREYERLAGGSGS